MTFSFTLVLGLFLPAPGFAPFAESFHGFDRDIPQLHLDRDQIKNIAFERVRFQT